MLGIGEPMAQKLRMAADDHQQVVEIVRDAAGQLAKGFHLLRLGELLLCPLERDRGLPSFGDVTRDVDEADETARLIADRLNDNACPKLALVSSHTPALEAVLALIGGRLKGSSRLPRLLLFVGKKSTEVPAQNFCCRVLMNSLCTNIPVGDASVLIEQKDGVIGNSLNDRPKAPLALHERLLRLATFGNVVPECVFDSFALLDFGIEGFTGFLGGRRVILKKFQEVLALTHQIILGVATGGDILGDCHEVTHGIAFIKDGGNAASDTQACAVR